MLLKNERGFTLVEMLLSVSIWFMLCVTLLPQLMLIITERRNTDIYNIGTQLLSEELQKEYNGDSSVMNIVKDGVSYNFQKSFNGELQKWELCVNWEDKLSKTYERCGYINGGE
ncbi:type II secretion system protein [Bacillus sp. REN16]|uniref:type II secretion system protein n=1 Tax=Bacillus sp. REN16 TaxID=2887296 RepID=UPI001E3BD542|nr:type II secretion system protein [Bacillus sp. REN16]MCC3356742.1 type II secretion system GspH family protein [Bacillus sp. REN16]